MGEVFRARDARLQRDVALKILPELFALDPERLARFRREAQVRAAVSPDGRWLAYTSDATGQTEIWVRPYPGPGAAVRVSPSSGVEPIWARNGRELYYLEGVKLMAVAVDTRGDFAFKPPVHLFDTSVARGGTQPPSYDVADDGRFLIIKPANARGAVTTLTVVNNWSEKIRQQSR